MVGSSHNSGVMDVRGERADEYCFTPKRRYCLAAGSFQPAEMRTRMNSLKSFLGMAATAACATLSPAAAFQPISLLDASQPSTVAAGGDSILPAISPDGR